jgi:cell cycle sensor histidine kinase DivJ
MFTLSLAAVLLRERRRSSQNSPPLLAGLEDQLPKIVHELRAPLNAIMGFAELSKYELANKPGMERHSEYAGLIHASSEHMLGLVNNILDNSRLASGNFSIKTQPLAIAEVIDDVSAMLRASADRKSLTVSSYMQTDIPIINADRQACRQIIINLLSNAIKFTPEGGAIKLIAATHKDMVEIKIKDNGIGVPPADMPHLGKDFVQAGDNRDGSGLGLSIVKSLVNLHNGEFEFRSTQGVGSQATIRLPVEHVPDSLSANDGMRAVVNA